jgi:DNA-binding PadR family transcriptional regulator
MHDLTTTSYAILGLLAVQPWTTYELAKQVDVSLRNFWPRAERKLYEEPKKLVARGLAEMSRETVGRRPRTVYRITPEGRLALRAWLGEPGAMPMLEFETLVKVFFAEHGTRQQLIANLQAIHAAAEQRGRIDAQWAAYLLTTGGRFPQRLAVIALVGSLQAEFNRALGAWADWALETVADWPADLQTATPPREKLADIAAMAGPPLDVHTPPAGYEQQRRVLSQASSRPATPPAAADRG